MEKKMQFIKFSLVAINLGAAGYTLYEWKKMDHAMRVFALLILIMTFIAAIPGFVQGAMYVWEPLGGRRAWGNVMILTDNIIRIIGEQFLWMYNNPDGALFFISVLLIAMIVYLSIVEGRALSEVEMITIALCIVYIVGALLLLKEGTFPLYKEYYQGHF